MTDFIKDVKNADEEIKTITYSLAWVRGYKTFFMLHSAEHEIWTANEY